MILNAWLVVFLTIMLTFLFLLALSDVISAAQLGPEMLTESLISFPKNFAISLMATIIISFLTFFIPYGIGGLLSCLFVED